MNASKTIKKMMNFYQDLIAKKEYISPQIKAKHIEIEESFAASSIQPINNYTEVKEEWIELGDITKDVEW